MMMAASPPLATDNNIKVGFVAKLHNEETKLASGPASAFFKVVSLVKLILAGYRWIQKAATMQKNPVIKNPAFH